MAVKMVPPTLEICRVKAGVDVTRERDCGQVVNIVGLYGTAAVIGQCGDLEELMKKYGKGS